MWTHNQDLHQPLTDNIDLEQFSLLLCDGHNMENAVTLSRECRALGIPVVVDAGSVKENEAQLLANATHLIASSRYLNEVFAGQTPLVASSILLKKYPQLELAGFTLGHAGFQGKCRCREYLVRGLEVSNLVDSTGAGDVFHGAFGYALLKTNDIKQSLEYANFWAAQSCKYYGSVNAVERMCRQSQQELNQLLPEILQAS